MSTGFRNQASNASDKSQRSVFIGNISYDISEETIRSIFSKVGPIVSIKMVYDRETGKPKGYGFIEYPDIGTAESAIRNLNAYELNGRSLRVDSAVGGMNMEEFGSNTQNPISIPIEESPFGPECDAGKAPEHISKCVASLAPEKMFELMKQMKEVVRSTPNEVKSMLTTNPQLAYALLQAQVVMRIVDTPVAMSMLHRETPTTLTPFHQQTPSASAAAPVSQVFPNNPSAVSGPPPPINPIRMNQPAGYGNYPPPQPSQQPSFQPPPTNFPPPSAANFAPPPIQQNSEMSAEEQKNAELLMQVMRLSEEDMNRLPARDRDRIIELRKQLNRK